MRRMAWVLKNVWTEENVVNRVNEIQAMLQPDMKKECARWGGSVSSWEGHLKDLRKFAAKRTPYVLADLQDYFNFSKQKMRGYTVYRVLFVIVIFLGGVAAVDLIWNIADAFLAVMIILNMISLVFVGHKVIPVINDFIRQRKAGTDPVFHAKEAGVENTECWD